MASHAPPSRTRADGKATDRAPVPNPETQRPRCLGPAAQLAAVHRTLRGGAIQPAAATAPAPGTASRTGLPDRLKAGVEALSGLSMEDVRVHRNSGEPAKLGALAYTRGSDIHVAPGQDEHLPHEAWHVVQQKQGRVTPTLQMKGIEINDDSGLESEADLFGARAHAAGERGHRDSSAEPASLPHNPFGPVQLKKMKPKKSAKATEPQEEADVASPDKLTTPKMWRYTTSIADKTLKTRSDAMVALAGVYGEVGKEYKAQNQDFLSRNTLASYIQQRRTTDSELFKRFSSDGKFDKDSNKKNKAALDLDSFRGDSNIPLIDPVFLDAESAFEKDQNSTHSLTVTIKFAEDFEGYVVAVKDSALEVEDVLTKARKPYGWLQDLQKEGEKPRGNLVKGSYSNTHHKPKAEAEPVGDVLTAARAQNRTMEAVERGIDAICKFVAESGRFRAARALGGALSDKSVFYIQVGNKDEYKSITFQGLYLTWMTLFGKAYDIADDKLAAQLISPPQVADAATHIKGFKKDTAGPIFHSEATHYDLKTGTMTKGSPFPPPQVPAPAPVVVAVQPQPNAPPSVDPKPASVDPKPADPAPKK